MSAVQPTEEIQVIPQGKPHKSAKMVMVYVVVLLIIIFLLLEISTRLFALYGLPGCLGRVHNTFSNDREFCYALQKEKLLAFKDLDYFKVIDSGLMSFDARIGMTHTRNVTFTCNGSFVKWGSGDNPPKFMSTYCDDFRGKMHTNLQGALSTVPSFKSDSLKLRIVTLGDSYTEGIDAPPLLSYPDILQSLIPDSEIINFGQSGIGIDTMYAKFEAEARNLSPQVVIMGIYVEDVARAGSQCGGWIKPTYDDALTIAQFSPSPEEVLRYNTNKWYRSYVIGFLRYSKYNWPCADTMFERGMALLEKMLGKLASESDHLIVGIITSDLYTPLEQKREKEIQDLLNRMHIDYVKNRPIFENNNQLYQNKLGGNLFENNLQVFFSRHHFSVYGNALFAQALRDKLIAKGVVPVGKQYYFIYFDHSLAFFVKNNDSFSFEKVISPLFFLNMSNATEVS